MNRSDLMSEPTAPSRPLSARPASHAPAPATDTLFLPEEPAQSAVDAGGRPSSLRHYLYLWRRYHRLAIIIGLVSVIGAAVRVLLLVPDVYMAKVTILPSGSQGQSGVMGLLATFTGGPPIAMGGGDETSSAFFPRILESRTLGLEVLRASYAIEEGGRTIQATLYEYLQAENEDEALLALAGLRAIDIDKETGMLTLSVRTGNPQLSAQICERYADALEKFNDETRRANALQHGKFIRERVNEVVAELAEAEEALAQFKANNVRMNDPDLELARMRLEREVLLKSQVFTTLTSQAEVARIEEAKNLPIIRILDRPHVPVLPVPVPLVASVAAGGIIGIVATLLIVAGVEFWRHLRDEMQHI